jgi:hypothetical membrane protein
LVSVALIGVAAELTSGAPHAVAAAVSFLLFLPATLLMGATLPMLIAYAVQSSGNVGVSTGGLYAINTLGAALGALSVGFFLLYWFDLRDTVQIAAGLNVLAALVVASALLRRVQRMQRAEG